MNSRQFVDIRPYTEESGNQDELEIRPHKKRHVVPKVPRQAVLFTEKAIGPSHRRARAELLDSMTLPGPLLGLWECIWGDPVAAGRIVKFWLESSGVHLREIIATLCEGRIEFTLNPFGIGIFPSLGRVPFSLLGKDAVKHSKNMIPRESVQSIIWENESIYAATASLQKCIWNERLTEQLPRARLLVMLVALLGENGRALSSLVASISHTAADLALKQCAVRLMQVLASCPSEDLFSFTMSCALV